jgi:hypothetical protein
MRVEYVNIFKLHALQTLIKACNKVFARSPFTIRAVPHQVTGFGCYDHLVPVRRKVFSQNGAENGFCRSGRGTVIVARSKQVIPLSKAVLIISLQFLKSSLNPKLCHRPRDIAGRSKPLFRSDYISLTCSVESLLYIYFP